MDIKYFQTKNRAATNKDLIFTHRASPEAPTTPAIPQQSVFSIFDDANAEAAAAAARSPPTR
jgi:hypothetical protein